MEWYVIIIIVLVILTVITVLLFNILKDVTRNLKIYRTIATGNKIRTLSIELKAYSALKSNTKNVDTQAEIQVEIDYTINQIKTLENRYRKQFPIKPL